MDDISLLFSNSKLDKSIFCKLINPKNNPEVDSTFFVFIFFKSISNNLLQ